jgi:hypothetical protein
MAPWGFPESHQPISPSHCFDFEGYYNSSLTPDLGSQHSSPTIPELPGAGSSSAPLATSNTIIDPFLDVGHWGFESEQGRNCGHDIHEQITPKAFEHAPMSFSEGMMLGSHDSDQSMDYQQMQWMDSNCHGWTSHQ